MIDIIYDKFKNTTRIELSLINIFKNYELPLTVEFKNYVDGEICWKRNLYPGMWIEWDGGEAKYNFVINSQIKKVLEWKYQVENFGSDVEKYLYYYIKNSSNRTKVIIIGSNDGRYGGWIFPVIEDLCDVVMIDGGLKQLERAKIVYSNLKSCKFINEIITPNGEDVIWYESGSGDTDTMNYTKAKDFCVSTSQAQCNHSL